MPRFVIVSKDAIFSKEVKNGLTAFPEVEMVVTVTNASEAENKIIRRSPTILLFDLDTVPVNPDLVKRMTMRFTNVLVVTTAMRQSTARMLTIAGLRDFTLKPVSFNNAANVHRYISLILNRMKGVVSETTVTMDYKTVSKTVSSSDKIVAIAASTGGVEALEKVISGLPADMLPIVLVQHMPSGFTNFFADRLNGKYPQLIKEAKSGDYLLQGQILIAPAGNHMQLVQRQGKLAVECFLGAKMHGVIPAADVLFESVANICRRNAIGVVLTGMGADGGRGLMLMHNNGARTIGQDKSSSVVYGMPKVAKDLGAVDYELDINEIANKIMELA